MSSNDWKVVCYCDKKDCVSCWTQSVETELYELLSCEEITTKEKFEEDVSDYFHDTVEYCLSGESDYNVDRLLADYGFHKAFLIYFNEYNTLPPVTEEENISRTLLYVVCYNTAYPSWEAYEEYLKKEDKEDEEEKQI